MSGLRTNVVTDPTPPKLPAPHGWIILDKPRGVTSTHAVARIKRIFDARKVGHAGTLDPFATGVLVCCINQATRLARFFLHGDKQYEAVLRLGTTTDTQDATGEIIARNPVPALTNDRLQRVFEQFKGRQLQLPRVSQPELADAMDSKSIASDSVPVQVRPPVPLLQ